MFGLLQILDNIRRSKIILDIFLQLLLPLILKKVNWSRASNARTHSASTFWVSCWTSLAARPSEKKSFDRREREWEMKRERGEREGERGEERGRASEIIPSSFYLQTKHSHALSVEYTFSRPRHPSVRIRIWEEDANKRSWFFSEETTFADNAAPPPPPLAATS